ncbi:MAG TPA: STAS domain-containing protein [Gaiella sp.]|nr:STAS domain-containing protein [Gaiella sp.]
MYQPFELGPGDGMAIVTLRGELDAHDAPRLRELFGEAMEQVQGADRPRVVLDLTGVAFLDSTALGTMVGVLRRVREAGGELRVVLPETTARRIFEITGLDDVLSVYPTRAAALEVPAPG